ncbi:adenylate/guanylate cyclase domain-containing protein [Rubrivirga marina]|uniref:Guanylate cyclase domain-containing protein n=1 Tax=Rubrivirga marina TaxID=1196024 RepID=A0A271J579_9BACT|nr:adenylate/guanylate cyclase domain-containing protein [Rubrivirga marina]PAP78510.1 hypothetical protein BSZ37_19810 [Rubrivirga marina]
MGRPRLGTSHGRQAARLAPSLIVAWTVTAFVAARVVGIEPPQGETVATAITRSAILGVVLGGVGAWLETGPLARAGRRFPLGAALAARTVAYALAVILGMLAIITVVLWVERRESPAEVLRSPQFWSFVRESNIGLMFVLLVGASFLINLNLQLRRVLGPETLLALLVGRYRRPVREERAFVFLDLTDSTAWAERLGPLAFTDFKNDFFADVAEPVLATGGRIVQYVGDEVMVSWPMKRAERDAAPLRFFFLVDARIEARAERYRQRYGEVPRFKAGCHGGWVVTAEVGDLKRDIVHSGDVVNTAARIEGECRPRGRRLIVSEALHARMPALEETTTEPLGDAPLRGKAEPVALVAIEAARLGTSAGPPAG